MPSTVGGRSWTTGKRFSRLNMSQLPTGIVAAASPATAAAEISHRPARRPRLHNKTAPTHNATSNRLPGSAKNQKIFDT